jgi:hypothetical protein
MLSGLAPTDIYSTLDSRLEELLSCLLKGGRYLEYFKNECRTNPLVETSLILNIRHTHTLSNGHTFRTNSLGQYRGGGPGLVRRGGVFS